MIFAGQHLACDGNFSANLANRNTLHTKLTESRVSYEVLADVESW